MKKTIIFLSTYFIFTTAIIAQSVQLSLNPGYSTQSFYSMQNGETQNVSSENWDIAFSVGSMSSAIRINDGKNVRLYSYTLGDTTDWNNINAGSTANIGPALYNSETSWSVGAFDLHQTSQFDLGWGIYSMITHHVTGDSLYLIETINGNWKKLWMKKLASGTYTFRHANLDGSNDVLVTIDKNNYTNKNFVYYSLDNNSIEDSEPVSTNWDMVFMKYISDLGMPYSVTGALINNNVEVAEANAADPSSYTDYSAHNFTSSINTIGYDWKSFQGTYTIDPNRCYFLRDMNQKIWRIVFTSFDGMSTGNLEFNATQINSTNIEESHKDKSFAMYPNPATENVTFVYDLNKNNNLDIFDVSGKKVYEKTLIGNGLKTYTTSLNSLDKGIYFVIISDMNKILVKEKLILH
tara:strand:- start:31870 stop:33090 length:1221 start_codon:yes stop_codon:yes gene_type:complete